MINKEKLLENIKFEHLYEMVGYVSSELNQLNNLWWEILDEDFFDNNFATRYKVFEKTALGNVSFLDNYIRFDNNKNLETISEYDLSIILNNHKLEIVNIYLKEFEECWNVIGTPELVNLIRDCFEEVENDNI